MNSLHFLRSMHIPLNMVLFTRYITGGAPLCVRASSRRRIGSTPI